MAGSSARQLLTASLFLWLGLCLWLPPSGGLEWVVDDPETRNKWIRASEAFDAFWWPRKQLIVSHLDSVVAVGQVSPSCVRALAALRDGLRLQRLWAYKCE